MTNFCCCPQARVRLNECVTEPKKTSIQVQNKEPYMETLEYAHNAIRLTVPLFYIPLGAIAVYKSESIIQSCLVSCPLLWTGLNTATKYLKPVNDTETVANLDQISEPGSQLNPLPPSNNNYKLCSYRTVHVINSGVALGAIVAIVFSCYLAKEDSCYSAKEDSLLNLIDAMCLAVPCTKYLTKMIRSLNEVTLKEVPLNEATLNETTFKPSVDKNTIITTTLCIYTSLVITIGLLICIHQLNQSETTDDKNISKLSALCATLFWDITSLFEKRLDDEADKLRMRTDLDADKLATVQTFDRKKLVMSVFSILASLAIIYQTWPEDDFEEWINSPNFEKSLKSPVKLVASVSECGYNAIEFRESCTLQNRYVNVLEESEA